MIRLRYTLRVVLAWLSGKESPFYRKYVSEPPETLKNRTIYVVGENGHSWFLVFRCPCGCGEAIHLSLLRDHRPRWRFQVHRDGTLSIFPSVWRTRGCLSHFFVRGGDVVWVNRSWE